MSEGRRPAGQIGRSFGLKLEEHGILKERGKRDDNPNGVLPGGRKDALKEGKASAIPRKKATDWNTEKHAYMQIVGKGGGCEKELSDLKGRHAKRKDWGV